MAVAALPHFEQVLTPLADAVACGAPAVSTPSAACDLIDSVELIRRLGAVAAVDVLQQIDQGRAHYEHGHATARIMYAHIADVSGAESHRLDKIRRMTNVCDDINEVWRAGGLSIDKAALLGRAFANPRSRDRFLLDQKFFLKHAAQLSFKRFERKVARWLELHDCDGPDPAPDPSHERRHVKFVQDAISKAWKLDGTLGSLKGSEFNEILQAYIEAEFNHDWERAEKIHGADTSVDLLERTHAQRQADALSQIAADAVNSDKPSAPVKRVHNIIYNAETAEELIRRWAGGSARILDPDTYNISDIDGHPIAASEAFADMLVASFRRVVQNAAGVTLDISKQDRFFTGLNRLGVQLTTTECYWPGCGVPSSRCQIDHLKPAARGGQSRQLNGLPACKKHNRFKERGYTVTRKPDGQITITTPTGDTIR